MGADLHDIFEFELLLLPVHVPTECPLLSIVSVLATAVAGTVTPIGIESLLCRTLPVGVAIELVLARPAATGTDSEVAIVAVAVVVAEEDDNDFLSRPRSESNKAFFRRNHTRPISNAKLGSDRYSNGRFGSIARQCAEFL